MKQQVCVSLSCIFHDFGPQPLRVTVCLTIPYVDFEGSQIKCHLLIKLDSMNVF